MFAAKRVPVRVMEWLSAPYRVLNSAGVVLAAAFMVKSCSSSGPSTDRSLPAGVRLSAWPSLAKVKL